MVASSTSETGLAPALTASTRARSARGACAREPARGPAGERPSKGPPEPAAHGAASRPLDGVKWAGNGTGTARKRTAHSATARKILSRIDAILRQVAAFHRRG